MVAFRRNNNSVLMHLISLIRRHRAEIMRFLTVGAASALLNTLIIVAFTELLGLHYLLSYLLCFMAVTAFGFAMNRHWTFRIASEICLIDLLRYFTTTVVGTMAAMGGSVGLVAMGAPYYVAVFAASALVAPVNFVAHRLYSFGLDGEAQ